MRQCHESHSCQYRHPRVADETGEDIAVVAVRLQPAGHTLNEVEERPTADDDVIAQYHERDKHACNALDAPPLARRELGKGRDRIGMCVPADEELAHHDRDANHGNADEIDEDERRAAIVADLRRETPHVAQTDGRACGCQHGSQLAAKITSFICHSTFNNLPFTI